VYHQRRTGGSTAIVREQPSEAAAQAGDQSAESVGAGAREARNNRIDCLAALVLVTLVLVVTALLEPDASGYGTHEKLFMFPCLFRWLTGLPCPACGMTTALAQMARGEVLAALDAHALGPIAYLLTWLLGGRAVYGLVTWLRLRRSADAHRERGEQQRPRTSLRGVGREEGAGR